MKTLSSWIHPLLACASLALSMATQTARADELHIATANTSTNALYEVFFGPTPPAGATALAATPINPNGGSSVRSLVYVSNEQTAKVDLIAADTTGGKIVRYAGSAGVPQTLWAWPVAGPRGTDGLSVDALGNLYVISSDAGRDELWVMRRDPALPPGAGFLPPLLVDNANFATTSKMRLIETVVVRSPIPGGPGSGDLLLLINDGRVLRYSAASLQAFLAGGRPIAPPQTLVTGAQCPAGQTPTGMALWPADGTLLVATVGGSVLRYTLTTAGSTLQTSFATGIGISLGKIKTFVNGGVPYAVFDQPLRGKVVEFGAPPAGGCPNLKTVCNAPLVTVTGVANPYALATTDSSAPTQDCVFNDSNPDHSCTLLSGAEKLGVSSANPGATIVDVACVIDKDPRVDPVMFTCDGTALPVASLCPGFGPTVIPGYLCGASGPSMRGLALIKSIEQNGFPVAPFNLLVKTELNADALLTPPNPGCPQLALGWAPLTGEGTIPEVNDMIELTSFCGSSRGLPPGHSLMGLGLQLNPNFFPGATLTDKLVYFANQKFDNLTATINSAPNMETGAQTALASCVAKAKGYLNDTVNLTPSTRYACSAHQAWVCDSTVTSGNFLDNPNQLSAYSAIRGRLANLVLTINTRLANNPASNTWPLADPGLPASPCDPDTTPPSTPVMLAPTNVTLTSLQINWQPSTDNPGGTGVGGYYVYRTGAASSPLATIDPSSCNPNCFFADSGLSVETTYSYQVVAFDKSPLGPNQSAPANSTPSTSPDNSAPTTPGSISQGTVTTTSVTLNWTASTDPSPGTGIGGYFVYRNGARTTVAPIAATSYTDTGLNPGTQYSYQVSSVDLSTSNNGGPNESTLGAPLLVTTLPLPDTTAPSVPTGLSSIYTGSKTLKVSWGASTDTAGAGSIASGVGGYLVYLNGTQVANTGNAYATVTLNTNTADQKFNVTVAAYDKAAPPNVSLSSAPLVVSCYDKDHDHDCDRFP